MRQLKIYKKNGINWDTIEVNLDILINQGYIEAEDSLNWKVIMFVREVEG